VLRATPDGIVGDINHRAAPLPIAVRLRLNVIPAAMITASAQGCHHWIGRRARTANLH